MKLYIGNWWNIIIFISLDKALKLDPQQSYLWEKKADVLKQLDRFDEALEW